MRILLYKRRKKRVKKSISLHELENDLKTISVYEIPIEQKAFELLNHHSFELGKVNQKEDVTFVVLNRVEENVCVVDQTQFHHTCPSYLMIQNNDVHVGCYACKKMKFVGKI